ncbi:LppU/SCO3897 family protein [Mycolicibacterium sp. HS_4_1]
MGEPVAAGAQLAPVGACVSLQGAPPEPSLSVVDCGSANNGFKVVQRVSTPAECTPDVDQRFYMNPEGGQFTACLDYAWSSKDCLTISKYSATRVACDATGVGDREKPVNVIADSTSIAGCPTGGFAHAVRRFTVCTQTVH